MGFLGFVCLQGWVRNRRDGSVAALFSGNPDSVKEMEQRCRRGASHLDHLCATSTLPLASPISILNYQFGFELRERRILRLKLQQGYRQCWCCNQSGDCSIKGGARAGRGSAGKVAELGSGLAGGRRRREGFRLGWAGLGLGRRCREGLGRDGGWAGLRAGWWGSQLHGGDTIAHGGSKYLFYFLIFLC
ncbi:uncharacterized protein LOC133784567 [Humulus lupulus]|uniref:uncharacterized protein LOC133784567 n=1 Tax=Humulus lupulus TaxID=3486 RepID=UPI002B40B114|nr:uncharacterized protein LOC133784567 [Humulus lupulus]